MGWGRNLGDVRREVAFLSRSAQLGDFDDRHREQPASGSVPDLDFRVLPLLDVGAAQIDA